MIESSAPFNWCDRRCERCPLRERCPVAIETRPIEEVLEEALRMIEESGERGDLPSPPPPREPPIEAPLLERAAYDWGELVEKTLHDGRGVLIVCKVARVLSEEEWDDPELHAMDIVPNLLLIERILDEVRPAMAPRAPGFDERDRLLRALLRPRLDAIPPADRAGLAALEAAGRAPSPFLGPT